jgi:membrane associated rhomboid family serine protease
MSLNSIATNLDNMLQSMHNNALFVGAFILIALVVFIANCCCKNRLNLLGIVPRKAAGLPGLLFAPWLHASLSHWFMNAVFFAILASMTLMIEGRGHFVHLCLFISVVGGFLTWLFARKATHIGASGVVMGLWGFLLINAFRNPSFIAIALAVIVVYFLGGMVINIIPKNDKSSWEAHLFGALAGIAAAFVPWLS